MRNDEEGVEGALVFGEGDMVFTSAGGEEVWRARYGEILMHALSREGDAFLMMHVETGGEETEEIRVFYGEEGGEAAAAGADALMAGIRANPVEVDEETQASIQSMLSMMAMAAGVSLDQEEEGEDDVVVLGEGGNGLVQTEEEMEALLASSAQARATYDHLCSVLVVPNDTEE